MELMTKVLKKIFPMGYEDTRDKQIDEWTRYELRLFAIGVFPKNKAIDHFGRLSHTIRFSVRGKEQAVADSLVRTQAIAQLPELESFILSNCSDKYYKEFRDQLVVLLGKTAYGY